MLWYNLNLLIATDVRWSFWLAVRPQRESAASRFCIPFCRNSNSRICSWNRWDDLVFYPSRMMFFSQAWIFHDRLACWFGRYDRPKHNCSSWSKNRTPLRRGARARNHTESIRKKHAFRKWTWFLKSPCSTDFAWSLACKPNIQNISPTWEFSFDFIELHGFSIFLDMSFPGCVRSCKNKLSGGGRPCQAELWKTEWLSPFDGFATLKLFQSFQYVAMSCVVFGLPEISGSRTVFSVMTYTALTAFASIATIVSGANAFNGTLWGDSQPNGCRFARRNFGKNDVERHDQSHPSEAMTMPGKNKRRWNSVSCFCAWKVGIAWILYHVFFIIFPFSKHVQRIWTSWGQEAERIFSHSLRNGTPFGHQALHRPQCSALSFLLVFSSTCSGEFATLKKEIATLKAKAQDIQLICEYRFIIIAIMLLIWIS